MRPLKPVGSCGSTVPPKSRHRPGGTRRFETERPALLALPSEPYLGWQEVFRQVSTDCQISFQGVRYSVPWAYAGKQVLVRQSQGRALLVVATSGQLLARHPLRPSGSPPVILPEHYEGLRRRHHAALASLGREFRDRYGAAGVAEPFLQRLLAQQRHRPDQALRQALDLLTAVPKAVALAAIAQRAPDAVEFNLCTPRFLEERLRQRHQELTELRDRPSPPPVVLPTQLTLPSLEVERPLAQYGRALDPTEPAAVVKGTPR